MIAASRLRAHVPSKTIRIVKLCQPYLRFFSNNANAKSFPIKHFSQEWTTWYSYILIIFLEETHRPSWKMHTHISDGPNIEFDLISFNSVYLVRAEIPG